MSGKVSMRRTIVRAVTAITVALPACVGLSLSDPATTPQCMQTMAGGDWATYGRDLQGTQRERAKHTINTANVCTLKRAWITGDTGYQSPRPIVSSRGVFISTGGHVEA